MAPGSSVTNVAPTFEKNHLSPEWLTVLCRNALSFTQTSISFKSEAVMWQCNKQLIEITSQQYIPITVKRVSAYLRKAAYAAAVDNATATSNIGDVTL